MATTDVAPTPQPVPATEPQETPLPPNPYSIRGAGQILLSSQSGRVGVVMFLVMLVISIWVVLTYPADFGTARWSSPAVWSDYPKAAPPSWTGLWDDGAVEQVADSLDTPTSVDTRGAAEIRDYRFTVQQENGAPPQFVSATIAGIVYGERAPVVVFTLLRPDGGEIRLANLAVPAPRPGETAPYRRYTDSPERVVLSDGETAIGSLAAWFGEHYPGQQATIGGNVTAALFGQPAADGSGRIDPLPGEYTLSVQVVVASPSDEVAEVGATFGGTTWGWMGTDSLGRDIGEGLLYGFPVALLIATLASLVSTAIGATLGIVSGYRGGVIDAVIQRVADVVNNVPVLPLLIFLVFIFGPNLALIITVLVAFSWPGMAILVRSMVIQLREGQVVQAAEALGASRWRIMSRHVFPQVAPYIVAQMIFFAPGAILAEASLSFLGLGDPSVPTWGQMLEAGFRTGALYVGYWWWVIPPGALIIVTALAFMLVALGMEQVVDPRLRRLR